MRRYWSSSSTDLLRPLTDRVRARLKWPDRRLRFFDLAAVNQASRRPRSDFIQIYSGANNVGNYLPVLGIWDLLGEELDTWNAHDEHIDFRFINRNYKGMIIGGAGLLHRSFESFWGRVVRECRIPTVAWGIGLCLRDAERTMPADERAVSISIGRDGLQQCDLVNVRDPLTASWYGIRDASITACPTIKYLSSWNTQHKESRVNTSRDGADILYASHEALLTTTEKAEILASVRKMWPASRFTDNTQSPSRNIDDVLQQYRMSTKVITTRLHGAVIAFGLDIPYVAIARDEKIRAFGAKYGGGIVIEEVGLLAEALEEAKSAETRPRSLQDVVEFGSRGCEWIAAHRRS